MCLLNLFLFQYLLKYTHKQSIAKEEVSNVLRNNLRLDTVLSVLGCAAAWEGDQLKKTLEGKSDFRTAQSGNQ